MLRYCILEPVAAMADAVQHHGYDATVTVASSESPLFQSQEFFAREQELNPGSSFVQPG